MANILPLETKKKNKMMYIGRFVSVILLLVSVLAIVAIALSLPSFMLTQSRVRAAQEVIIRHADTASSTTVKREFDRKIQKILEPEEAIDFVGFVNNIEEIKPEGVEISRIIFGKNEFKVKNSKPKIEYVMNVGGISPDRESLVRLEEEIERLERVVRVDLPVSQLAQHTDIDFALSFVITPLP